MAINIFFVQDYRKFLSQILGERCARNGRYSLRAFARDLKTAPSYLSLMFNCKSSLSLAKAYVFAERLGLALVEREYFLALVQKEITGCEREVLRLRQSHAFTVLSQGDELDPALSLQDFALYLKISLLGRVYVKDSDALFSIEPHELTAICHRLKDLGWIDGSEGEGWTALKGFSRTESFDPSESRRIFHQKVLELAQEQLHNGDMKERHFFSSVFSLHHEDYSELCQVLAVFCQTKSDAYASRDSHDRIYALGLQILPVGSLLRPIATTQ